MVDSLEIFAGRQSAPAKDIREALGALESSGEEVIPPLRVSF
jgi:hypothetical protein